MSRARSAAEQAPLPSSSEWSAHSRKYVRADGQSLSLPLVETAFEQHFFALIAAKVAEAKAKGQPARALCLCGGPGPEMATLCTRFGQDELTVLTTDLAQGMVDMANETIASRGWIDRADARVMDAMNIDADAESFDVVTLILGPMLLPDSQQCFAEVKRVLRPNGLFVTLTPSRMEIHDILTREKQQLFEVNGQDASHCDRFTEMVVQKWGEADVMAQRLKEGGYFQDVQAQVNHTALNIARTEEADEVLDSMFSNPGMSIMYTHDMNEEQKEQWEAAVRENLYSRFASGKGGRVSLSMHCCSASAMKGGGG